MHVSLTPILEEYAKKKVESGLYNDGSEVIREALRLMMQHDVGHERLAASVSDGFRQIEEGKYVEFSSREEFLGV